jgi:DNA repair protein RecN (Recombination protein N)
MAHSNATHLSELRVRNFALVEEQILSLHPGLNIITGESGSGKSVLLEAIAQLSGAPAREEAIRTGAECAELEGSFVIGEDKMAQVSAVLEKYISDAHGLFRFEGELGESKTLTIERRLVYIDGERTIETDNTASKSDSDTSAAAADILLSPRRIRSICRVNDATVPVKALRDLSDVLIDFNGQGTAASIANTDAQIALLDNWAGTGDLRRRFDVLAVELTVLLAELARLTELSPEERQELEGLIDNVHEVQPLKSEDDLLKAELRRIESARVTLETCSDLMSTLGGDETGGTTDARGGIKGNLNDATLQIKALLASARRASANSVSQDVKESDMSSDNEEGGISEFEAVLRGLEEALSMCHDAEILASQAQARIADYVAFSHAVPVRREECIGRLRELDRLCRLIGVHSVEEACDAAQVRHFSCFLLQANETTRHFRYELGPTHSVTPYVLFLSVSGCLGQTRCCR